MKLSVLLRNLKNITEGKNEPTTSDSFQLMTCTCIFCVEKLPKSKPYWLTKSNLQIPGKSRSIADLIQVYKAIINEPTFLKRNLYKRNNQRRNE
jgi:hypothetical protein